MNEFSKVAGYKINAQKVRERQVPYDFTHMWN